MRSRWPGPSTSWRADRRGRLGGGARTSLPDEGVGGPERGSLSVESQRYSPWGVLYGVAMIGTMRSGRRRAHHPPAVLIVADDELVAEAAVDAVAALGYRTTHVRDG